MGLTKCYSVELNLETNILKIILYKSNNSTISEEVVGNFNSRVVQTPCRRTFVFHTILRQSAMMTTSFCRGKAHSSEGYLTLVFTRIKSIF